MKLPTARAVLWTLLLIVFSVAILGTAQNYVFTVAESRCVNSLIYEYNQNPTSETASKTIAQIEEVRQYEIRRSTMAFPGPPPECVEANLGNLDSSIEQYGPSRIPYFVVDSVDLVVKPLVSWSVIFIVALTIDGIYVKRKAKRMVKVE